MKNRGFIMKQTLFLVFILLSISSLLGKAIRVRSGGERLEKENRERDYFLESVQEIALYELYILDAYLKKGELESLENYIYMDSQGESILNHYKSFTVDREKNRKSIGGYFLTKITPPLENQYIPKNYDFKIEFSKEIYLSEEGKEIMKVTIKTKEIMIRCNLNPYEEEIDCGKLGRIEEFLVLGEEIDEKENEDQEEW